jgi:hypothetical protein
MGKSMKPGGGGRFAAMVAAGVPPGAAANAGRKKYGEAKMAKWSAQGRKRAKKEKTNWDGKDVAPTYAK